MRPDWGADWVRLTGRTSGKADDEGLAVGENPYAGVGVGVPESSEAQAHGNSFCSEVWRLEAGQMSFGGVQQTVDVDDESGHDVWHHRPVRPKLNICWR